MRGDCCPCLLDPRFDQDHIQPQFNCTNATFESDWVSVPRVLDRQTALASTNRGGRIWCNVGVSMADNYRAAYMALEVREFRETLCYANLMSQSPADLPVGPRQ